MPGRRPGVQSRLPQGKGVGGTGRVAMFGEELCRIGSWGQCPEPTCCFQSQFYSLPCAIWTQFLHLKMGTIIPAHPLAPWDLGGLKGEAGEFQHPGGVSYCSHVTTLI